MKSSVLVFDPTASDKQSSVRGVGRYLQLLKENFPDWNFNNMLHVSRFTFHVFINPFFNFLQPPLLMKRIAKKQIAVIHDLIPLKYPKNFPPGIRGKINIYLNKLALKNYDLIVTDSETSKKDIVQILGVDKSRVKVIYPCLTKTFTDLEFIIQNSESKIKTKKNNSKFLNLNSKFCLYVGDATWNKNLVNLAKAIKIINIPCVFVGMVFNSSTRQLVNSLINNNQWLIEYRQFLMETKNDKRFIFLGFIDDYKLVKLYQQAAVNILVSRDEGFGFSYLEAANFACPSILSDIPVLREISNNQGAFFADPDDPYDMANKIGEIYFNPDLKNKLGFEAQKRSEFFSTQKFKNQWLSYLK